MDSSTTTRKLIRNLSILKASNPDYTELGSAFLTVVTLLNYRHNVFLLKFRQLHAQLISQFEVERQLSSKATLLHKQLMTENLNLEKAQ